MNFTNTIRLISASFLALFLSSCTEIIDISTNDAESQLVVEANIAMNETASVFLSKSIGLNEPNNFEMVGGATVRITDNTGKTEVLTEMSKGFYSSNTLKGEVGKTYSLLITSGTQTITSECKIPTLVPIDSFTVVNSIYPGGGPPRGNQPAPFYEIKLKYTDPADQQNFYRIVLYFNGKVQARNSIFDDKFTNGKQMESSVILFNDSVKVGDKISVELQCIDKEVHNYFASMGSAGGPPGASSSPANPYTNLNGAILGYFSAHTVERKEYELN
jgi:hypothetical protein